MLVTTSLVVGIIILIKYFLIEEKRYDQTQAVQRYYLQAASIEKRREIARNFFNKNYPAKFN